MNADIPEIPPEVANRKVRALTAETVELSGTDKQGQSKTVLLGASAASRAASAASRAARARAEEFSAEPHAGLTPEQITAVKARLYPDGPKYGMAGDRTQVFVDWLWANHPRAASIRYGYRDIWPTTLPKNWPPKNENFEAPNVSDSTVAAAKVPGAERTFTATEVEAMLKTVRNESAATETTAEINVIAVHATQPKTGKAKQRPREGTVREVSLTPGINPAKVT